MIKLYFSQAALEGPIEAKQGKVHPNGTATFHITDAAFLDRNGWSRESYVEVQARPMPEDRRVPRDKYAWENE